MMYMVSLSGDCDSGYQDPVLVEAESMFKAAVMVALRNTSGFVSYRPGAYNAVERYRQDGSAEADYRFFVNNGPRAIYVTVIECREVY